MIIQYKTHNLYAGQVALTTAWRHEVVDVLWPTEARRGQSVARSLPKSAHTGFAGGHFQTCSKGGQYVRTFTYRYAPTFVFGENDGCNILNVSENNHQVRLQAPVKSLLMSLLMPSSRLPSTYQDFA